MNAEEPENAQIVFGDAPVGIADEAHPPGIEIGQAADMIMHHAVDGCGKAVHREITSFGIALPVAPECHLGLAAKGLDVFAQCRDLERRAIDHQRHRAVLNARRYALDMGRLGAADHFIGHGRRGDIDFAHWQFHQSVAHSAADRAGFLAIAIEQRQHLPGRS
jgi:hypothetical protein